MLYAVLNGEKIQAAKGLKAICPTCQEEVIAKCGQFKVNHWAHHNREHCDPWWEPETEWHREWKSHFPKEYTEVCLRDTTGEKHIADVFTSGNLAIEFQHSNITEEERISREVFYMKTARHFIWIVDGNRGFTFKKFQLGFTSRIEVETDMRINWYGTSKIFDKWGKSRANVLIDFGTEFLWWLKRYDSTNRIITANPRDKQLFIRKNAGPKA